MTRKSSKPMSTEERLVALELRMRSQSRSLKLLVSLLSVALAIMIAAFRSESQEVQQAVKAKTIELVDESGRTRVSIYAGNQAAGLVLYDTAKRPTIALDSFPDGPALSLFDPQGKRRSRSVVYRGQPLLEFLDSNETPFFRIP